MGTCLYNFPMRARKTRSDRSNHGTLRSDQRLSSGIYISKLYFMTSESSFVIYPNSHLSRHTQDGQWTRSREEHATGGLASITDRTILTEQANASSKRISQSNERALSNLFLGLVGVNVRFGQRLSATCGILI